MRDGERRGPEPVVFLVALAGLLAALLAVPFWLGDPIFSLGLLVAPWATWRVARERGAGAPAPAAARAAALAATVALAAAGWWLRSIPLAVWAFGAALLALALERGAARRAVLPLALLALTAPPPGFESALVDAQVFVAVASGAVLALAGMPVVRDAWTLHTPHFTFHVEPICTGISGLLATTALVGIVAAHLGAPRRRLALALAIGVAATLALNVLRIVVTVFATERWGAAFAENAFHSGVSLALALAAFGAALPALAPRRAPA